MSVTSLICSVAHWIVIPLFFLPTAPEAYLDPGTGSIIWQVLLASLLTAIYMFQRYWSRVRQLFSAGLGDPTKQEDRDSDKDDHG